MSPLLSSFDEKHKKPSQLVAARAKAGNGAYVGAYL
jgi:hypothetical protein